jgi:glycosyltransferase involved in cell wall biosynthesis
LSWLKNYKGKTPSDILRVGYIGQIIPIKGVHILVEAFKEAKLGGIVKLDIWGSLEKDQDYVDTLKSIILDDLSISLRGRFEHENLADVFSEIDVLVVPSIWYENAPLVIQESFATETPVITTNLGGMAEMVSSDVNGLLFERGDVWDLARQLNRLVTEPGLLEKLKTGAPKVKTIEDEVSQLEEMYFELLKTRKQNIKGEPNKS